MDRSPAPRDGASLVAARFADVSLRARRLAPTLALAVALLAPGCGETVAPRPNVLVYVVDTLRADALGSYGNAEAHTPHFDALASEGVAFDNAYATSSWTRASMATLLTGLHPWHHGAESRDDRLPETARTLAELFAEQGYSTALISSNPNVSSVFGFRQAFDELAELYARSKPGVVGATELVTPSNVVTNEVIGWLRGASKPFFVVALAIDPHFPYRPPARHDPGLHRSAATAHVGTRRPGRSGANTPEAKARARELYQAEVAFNDESFGALVAAMKQLGLWDDTVVVVTSDHGEEFWEYDRAGHGQSLTEEVLRVPLIVRKPGDARLPAGVRTERPISLVDLAPTLLELAGIPVPEELDGQSIFSASDEPRVVLAGLRLDGRHLLAAVDGHDKLVWDLRSDRRQLYDLSGGRPELWPLEVGDDPRRQAASSRLAAAIETSVARPGRALDKSRAGKLPEAVEESLRALGYLE